MRLGTALKVLATVAGRRISAGVEEKEAASSILVLDACFEFWGVL
jgi:hypothetical protein